MTKNLKITVDEDTLRWARFCAAKRKLSVSEFVGQIIDREQTGEGHPYLLSFEDWKEFNAKGPEIGAENTLMARDEEDEL